MINVCEDDLICDFAETYRILDYRALSPTLAATLCVGLRDDSRVRMKLSKAKISIEVQLLALISDWAAHIAWMLSSDGHKGINHPAMVSKLLNGEEKTRDIKTFQSAAAFEAERERILRRINNDG